MDFPLPEESGDDSLPDHRPAGVVVATERPLSIRVERIHDDRAPDGMAVLASFLGDRLVARCAVSEEAVSAIQERDFFRDPTRLVLAATEAPPGLKCHLFALVELKPGDLDQEDEAVGEEAPWAASLPGAHFDREAGQTPAAPGDAPPGQAAVLLGEIVRFERDRKHRESLPLEAVDVLATIVQGQLVEVVDKVLDDLLG